MEETMNGRGSLAAPLIFLIVVVLQLLTSGVEHLRKRGSRSAEEIQLREEIRLLLKEASSLSNPSTFAQAAKLKRMAAAKERELQKSQELYNKGKKLSYGSYLKALLILKVCTYFALIFWLMGVPVAVISQQLLQPFGRLLSWRTGDTTNGNVMVGIIPWLIISTRVSKFIFQKLL